MPHHWPKSTVEANIWCNRCNKETPWRIHDGRQQYCLTCFALRRETSAAPKPVTTKDQAAFDFVAREPEQDELFPL